MKTYLAVILSLLLMASCGHTQSLKKEVMDQVKGATVFIKVDYKVPIIDLTTSASGSGFFINEHGYIATNYHVIEPLVTLYTVGFPVRDIVITAVQHSGKKEHRSFDCKVMSVDKENDLAILKITDTITTPFLTLHTEDDQVETAAVWVFGYPFGEAFSVIQRGPEISVTKGGITALRHNDKDILSTIQIDAVVNPGNSGGPCINEQGKVIGIINMTGGETHHNFGIPSHYLSALIKPLHMPAVLPNEIQLTVNTDPTGAKLFIGGDSTGYDAGTPIAVTPGWQAVYVLKQGYETFMKEISISGDTSLDTVLNPVKPVLLVGQQGQTNETDISLTELPKDGEVLLREHFDLAETFQSWEQSTGGLGVRTWFLENSKLRQFDKDGMLHSIYLGESSWNDYVVKTKIKIDGDEGDPRAGLIFRETEQGFYLFRIYRESNKAQLAYHGKYPFGWTVLMEKELDSIDDGWYDLAVTVKGDMVGCFLNSKCIFYTAATYSDAGRIGFYSVESQPHFDSLEVLAIGGPGHELSTDSAKGVLSYWFTENFDFDSQSWYQYKDTPDQPYPWFFSDAGCMQEYADEHSYTNEFTRYRLQDFSLSTILTVGTGNDAGIFEFFFGKTDQGQYTLRFLKKENEVQLLQKTGANEKLLKKKKLSSQFFGTIHGLGISMEDGVLTCKTSRMNLLEYSGKLIDDYQGTFGFNITQAPLVLHQLRVTSVW